MNKYHFGFVKKLGVQLGSILVSKSEVMTIRQRQKG